MHGPLPFLSACLLPTSFLPTHLEREDSARTPQVIEYRNNGVPRTCTKSNSICAKRTLTPSSSILDFEFYHLQNLHQLPIGLDNTLLLLLLLVLLRWLTKWGQGSDFQRPGSLAKHRRLAPSQFPVAAAQFSLVQRPPAILHNSIPSLAATSSHHPPAEVYSPPSCSTLPQQDKKLSVVEPRRQAVSTINCLPSAPPPKRGSPESQTVLPAVPSVAGISYQNGSLLQIPIYIRLCSSRHLFIFIFFLFFSVDA